MNEPEVVAGMIWMACRGEVSTKSMMFASCGRTALSVRVPLRGIDREMVFVRSGLQIGTISPVNMGHTEVSDGAAEGRGSRDGVGASA